MHRKEQLETAKKRVALVRGPELNSWEMQNFSPLMDQYELTGFASRGHYFPLSEIPFRVQKFFSIGQALRLKAIRAAMSYYAGDYHDLQGIGRSLQDFDIVHTVDSAYYCSYQCALAKRSAGFKLVVTVWENIPFLRSYPRTERNKRVLFEEADLILAASERARETLLLEGAPADRTAVLMPGIDIRHFSPAPKDESTLKKLGLSRDDVIILFVGNLYREKGIFDLLLAFRRLLDRERSIRTKLLLVGKGRDRAAAEEFIRKLQLEKNVTLAGSFSYSMMPKIHNLADVFVLPSIPTPTWQEQFGYVLVESMACGKAVISTMSGSIPEVVGNAGILVPPNDFVSLGNAIAELVSDRKKRDTLGKKAVSRVKTLFNAQQVAKQMRNHYQSVLAR